MFSKKLFLSGLSVCFVLSACGQAITGASTKTVDLPQSQVKWQSIGNCWIYAAMGWVESEYLKANGVEINLSETYISYRHFENQLLKRPFLDEIQTGGFWAESRNIVLTYGLIKEGDFIPQEGEKTFSQTQSDALNYLNNSLKNGPLKEDRSPATVRAELDAAFGVVLADVQDKIFPARTLSLGRNPDGSPNNIDLEIRRWNNLGWPRDWSSVPSEAQLPQSRAGQLTSSQKDVLRRVKRALNDGNPVVMNWWVDFNALDETGTFSLETVAARGPGRQGYHSTVIEDYVVKGTDALGKAFYVGEGDSTLEQKKLAELYGDIQYFVIKNSWGGAERLNRASYSRFGVKGYTKLDASYLFGWMRQEEEGQFTGAETGLNGFIIPEGY